MKTFFSLSILSLFFSCAMLGPTEKELASLDYGDAPKNYKEIYIQGLKDNLKDPDSLKVTSIQEPKKMWYKDIYNGTQGFWIICGFYNAKNSFGAYAGYEEGAVWYRYGDAGVINLINGEMPGLASQYTKPCDYRE